jgi:hypothetical protein
MNVNSRISPAAAAIISALSVSLISLLPTRAANINWTNVTGGNWSVAANWDPNSVPGASDSALITAAGTYTVTLDISPTVGGITLGGASGTQTLAMNGQTLSLNGGFTVNANGSYTLNSGKLVGNTNAILTGIFYWTGSGGSQLNGILTLASGSTLNVNGGGSDHDMPNCTLTNNGTVAWTIGRVRGGGTPGTVIYNNGLWDSQADLTLNADYGGAGTIFNNIGTFRKSASASASVNTVFTGGVLLNNSGNFDSQTNYIVLQGGGNFTGGTATNLVGIVYLNGGAFNINGTITSTNVQLAGGTLTGNNVIRGGFNWITGDWNGAASVTISNASILDVTSANDHNMANTFVTNNGTVAWSGGRIRGGGTPGTFIYNNGLWDSQGDLTLNNGFGGSGMVFNNGGTFRKSASASAAVNTVFNGGVLLNNTGNFDSQTNYIVLQGGGNFVGGTATNLVGIVYLNGGAFNINGTITSTNVQLAGGTLTGNNVIRGGFNWITGDWNGAASVTISNASILDVTSANDHNMADTFVTNNGTVAWSGGRIRGGGTPGTFIYNNGLWDVQCDGFALNSDFGGAGTFFNNFGTFRKSVGSVSGNTTFANVPFNQLSGAVDVQAGNLVLQGSGNFTGGFTTTNSTGLIYLSSGNFNLNGAVTSSNVIENAGNLIGTNVITGELMWQAGNWDSAPQVTLATNSVLYVNNGADHDMGNCTFTNNGAVAWSNGRIRGGGNPGTVIYNNGLWDVQCDGFAFNNDLGGAATVFNNFGTFRKSVGPSSGNTTFANVLFNQLSGAVDVRKGNFALQGGGNFTGGTDTNSVGFTVLSIGNFNINGALTTPNVIENSGNLIGMNILRGGLTWGGGNWDGASSVTLNNGILKIATGADHDMANCTVTNNDTVLWQSGRIRGGGTPGTVVYNNGLWNAQADFAFNNDLGGVVTVFNNTGTFRKELSTGTTSFSSVTFNNSGMIDAQDGNIALASGYTLANGTRMGFGLGGSLGNGSISLSGAAAFTGSVSVNLNGFFWPAAGSTFNLLNYTLETGTLFTNTVLPGPGYLTWTTNYGSTIYSISVVAHIATNTTPTNVFISTLTGTNVLVEWPGDHTGWRLQSQTNPLSSGLGTNWVALSGSSLTNQIVMPIDKTLGTVFYRMIYP